jgi:cell division septal protein FtsQ
MFGKKKPEAQTEQQLNPQPDPRPDGEPTPASGRVRPEESVLDELSRAFGTEEIDDNADLIADGIDDSFADSDDPTAELRIVTSDGIGSSASEPHTPTPPAERSTIRIGNDFGSAMVDTVPLRESIGAPDVMITERRPADSTRGTIALGGGDDHPDAMYLDSALDDDSGTVFIDDDGTGDVLAIKDATTPGIEPRLRQRRIGVRREASRKRIKWVVLGALGITVVLGILTVLGSGWFAIDDVEVSGAVYTDENRLQLVIDELDGTPVLLADTEAAERELEAIPWVEDARVRTNFPNSATIEIRERTPVATMAGIDGRFRVLDNKGRVLDVIDGQPVAFILLSGPSTLDLAAGQFAPVGPSWAAALVTKLTPTIRPRVISIEVTDDGSDLVMNLTPSSGSEDGAEQTTPIRVRFGSAIGDSDQIEKLVRLEDRLDDLPTGTITEINVTTNEVTDL